MRRLLFIIAILALLAPTASALADCALACCARPQVATPKCPSHKEQRSDTKITCEDCDHTAQTPARLGNHRATADSKHFTSMTLAVQALTSSSQPIASFATRVSGDPSPPPLLIPLRI